MNYTTLLQIIHKLNYCQFNVDIQSTLKTELGDKGDEVQPTFKCATMSFLRDE